MFQDGTGRHCIKRTIKFMQPRLVSLRANVEMDNLVLRPVKKGIAVLGISQYTVRGCRPLGMPVTC